MEIFLGIYQLPKLNRDQRNDFNMLINPSAIEVVIKSSRDIRDTREYINIIQVIYSKPTENINLNEERLKTIPLKSGTRPDCPLCPYLFNIVFDVLTRAKTTERDQGDIIWKGRT